MMQTDAWFGTCRTDATMPGMKYAPDADDDDDEDRHDACCAARAGGSLLVRALTLTSLCGSVSIDVSRPGMGYRPAPQSKGSPSHWTASQAARAPGTFWADVNRDLEDGEFRRHYVRASRQIAATDDLANDLDASREA